MRDPGSGTWFLATRQRPPGRSGSPDPEPLTPCRLPPATAAGAAEGDVGLETEGLGRWPIFARGEDRKARGGQIVDRDARAPRDVGSARHHVLELQLVTRPVV